MRHLAVQAGLFLGTILLVSLLSFLLVAFLPGDLALIILGDSATPELVRQTRERLGLDDPVLVRYVSWLAGAFQGDLGISFRSGEPVLQAILSRLPVTLELMVLTQLVALLMAVPLGVWTAYRKGSWGDRTIMSASVMVLSAPSFLIGVVLIYVFALQWQILPATGFIPLSESIWGNLRTVALPVLALALNELPVYLRVLRSEMIQTLQQNFILLTRAMGLPTRRILLRNALRPSSLNLITTVGINMGRLMGGAIVIEVLFGLPGVGQLLVESIYQSEFYVMQGIVLLIAIIFVCINLAVDMVYTVVDPRLRTQGGAA